jgi:predicted  nucleic acid-binding Zn-ribbon protein
MMCKMVKRGLIGVGTVALVSGLLWGPKAWNYLTYGVNSVREAARDAVPIEADIDAARQQIDALEPAIHQNIENLARAEVDIEHLQNEIVAIRENLGKEGKAIVALRDSLKTGDFRLAGGGVSYTAEEVKSDLGRRLDYYHQCQRIVKEKEETLKHRQKSLVAAREQLATMAAKKRTLTTKIEGIRARLAQIHAAQAANDFTFDNSALSQAQQSVDSLERKLDVMARVAEQEGHYSDKGLPVIVEPSRDVVKEIDAEFGPSTSHAGSDKSL